MRLTDLVSKLHLKEYQRSMVPYFKKNQLTELEGDKDRRLLSPSMLGERARSLIEGKDEDGDALRDQ